MLAPPHVLSDVAMTVPPSNRLILRRKVTSALSTSAGLSQHFTEASIILSPFSRRLSMYDSKVCSKSACERRVLRTLSPIIYLGDAAICDSTLRKVSGASCRAGFCKMVTPGIQNFH